MRRVRLGVDRRVGFIIGQYCVVVVQENRKRQTEENLCK